MSQVELEHPAHFLLTPDLPRDFRSPQSQLVTIGRLGPQRTLPQQNPYSQSLLVMLGPHGRKPAARPTPEAQCSESLFGKRVEKPQPHQQSQRQLVTLGSLGPRRTIRLRNLDSQSLLVMPSLLGREPAARPTSGLKSQSLLVKVGHLNYPIRVQCHRGKSITH